MISSRITVPLLALAMLVQMDDGTTRRAQTPLGERLSYRVTFSGLPVGSADMTLVGRDSVAGHPVFRAVLAIDGGIPLFRVHDSATSWFDSSTFVSRRFVQRIREGRFRKDRYFDIEPESLIYRYGDRPAKATSPDPLDDVSFIYFVRRLPLVVGESYVLRRYFQTEGNPITIHVVARDTVNVPAGQFPAIVVEPEITTDGIFSKSGRARIWLSDDSARILLQLKSRLSFGSINLYLRQMSSVRTGSPPRG